MSGTARVRKPITELSSADLTQWPIWEFVTDEEGNCGQDETWVRPSSHREIPRDSASLTVAADFTLGDGSATFLGHVDVTLDERFQFGDGPYCSLVIFGPNGIFQISSMEPTPQEVRRVLGEIGKPWERVFPIRFVLRAAAAGETTPDSGAIDGDAF